MQLVETTNHPNARMTLGRLENDRRQVEGMPKIIFDPRIEVLLNQTELKDENPFPVVIQLALAELNTPLRTFASVRSGDETGEPSRLVRSLTGGRSELVYLKNPNSGQESANDQEAQSAFPELTNILKAAYPEIDWDSMASLQIKIKGRGGKEVPSVSLFAERKSIYGYTGLDRQDLEIPSLLAGWHEVESPTGEKVDYLYCPGRIMIAAVPIRRITFGQGEHDSVTPGEWEEPLYLEFYVEVGGHNIWDLERANYDRNQLRAYYRQSISWHPMFKNIQWENAEVADEQLVEALVLKSYYDAQVEARYLVTGANRTSHNTVANASYQDFDDTKLKSSPGDDWGQCAANFLTRTNWFLSALFKVELLQSKGMAQIVNRLLDIAALQGNSELFEQILSSAPGLKNIGVMILERVLAPEFATIENRSEILGRNLLSITDDNQAKVLVDGLIDNPELWGEDPNILLVSLIPLAVRVNPEGLVDKLRMLLTYIGSGEYRSVVLGQIVEFLLSQIAKSEEARSILERMLANGFDLGEKRSEILSSIVSGLGTANRFDTIRLMLSSGYDLGLEPGRVLSAIAKSMGKEPKKASVQEVKLEGRYNWTGPRRLAMLNRVITHPSIQPATRSAILTSTAIAIDNNKLRAFAVLKSIVAQAENMEDKYNPLEAVLGALKNFRGEENETQQALSLLHQITAGSFWSDLFVSDEKINGVETTDKEAAEFIANKRNSAAGILKRVVYAANSLGDDALVVDILERVATVGLNRSTAPVIEIISMKYPSQLEERAEDSAQVVEKILALVRGKYRSGILKVVASNLIGSGETKYIDLALRMLGEGFDLGDDKLGVLASMLADAKRNQNLRVYNALKSSSSKLGLEGEDLIIWQELIKNSAATFRKAKQS